MNIHDLTQANGLKTFLFHYHQHLNQHHRFPPLTGMKPMHRAADVLGLASGESLQAAWAQLFSENTEQSRAHPGPSGRAVTFITKHAQPATENMNKAHTDWLRAMNQYRYLDAVDAIGKCWTTHPDSLWTAVRLGVAFRRNRQKNDAANLFTHALQLAESWQPAGFTWQNAAWEADNDEVWALGIAFISLAGMHMENGCYSLAFMYFDRWIETCERTDALSPRMCRMLALAREFKELCTLSKSHGSARVAMAQPLVKMLELAATVRDLESAPVEVDFGTATLTTKALFDLRHLRPFYGKAVDTTKLPGGLLILKFYDALRNNAVFIGEPGDVEQIIKMIPGVQADLAQNESIKKIMAHNMTSGNAQGIER